MIRKIVNSIVDEIQGVNWVSICAGIVDVVSVKKQGPDGALNIKTFPVVKNADINTCTPDEFNQLVPDSAKKSIIYFEDNGGAVTNQSNGLLTIEHNLRLVCWANMDKINPALDSGDLCANLLGYISLRPSTTSPILNAQISITNQVLRDKGIFGKYTYDDTMRQYLIAPYDYFAIDMRITYRVMTDCAEPITLNPKQC